jgi:peptidoglycan-N-acetylglucosamine deacetylase
MIKIPGLLKLAYPGVIWNMPRNENVLYLTFDDGPIPEVTPFVLKTLHDFNAKATFFCIGDNVKKHPDVYAQLLASGNSIGNHTYHHYNSWKVSTGTFINDTNEASKLIASNLFRPPYGKLTPLTLFKLKREYRIIMWDVISCDFDVKESKEKVLANVTNNAREGSIVVFHDSLKASNNMQYALPHVLEYFSKKGFIFKAIPYTSINN